MKKYIIMLVFAVVAMAASAQRGRVVTVAPDTITDTGTSIVVTIGPLTGNYETLTISALVTTLTGTSAGTITVYGSNDGTNYTLLNGVGGGVITASPVASLTGADLNQITITNALVANWVVQNAPQRYYKLTAVGSGTSTTQIDATYIIK